MTSKKGNGDGIFPANYGIPENVFDA